MTIWKIGIPFVQETVFTQEELDLFSQISGDSNPIHTREYVLSHPDAKGVIVQGMLATARFGQVLGSIFPGSGTVNMRRYVEFLKPLYMGEKYRMVFTLTDVDTEDHVGSIILEMKTENDVLCIKGDTHVMNDVVFTKENYPKERDSFRILETIPLPTPSFSESVSLHQTLTQRRSVRYFRKEELDAQQLSNLLWSANGVSKENVSEKGKKTYLFTNPTASNHQEVEVFVFMKDGVYIYQPIANTLGKILEGDCRSMIGRLPLYKNAPISLCLVSNIGKMIHHTDDFRKNLYSSMDVGYVSQNIYLHCTANHLATCACGLIDREGLGQLLHLHNAKVMLVHPIGIRKEK